VRITSSRSLPSAFGGDPNGVIGSSASAGFPSADNHQMQFGIRHGSDNGSGCGSDFGSDSESGRDRDRDGVAHRVERGQATVEFALVLVALVSVVWALLSLCLIVRDQVLVTHASREAARTYAVSRSLDAATLAARDRSGLGSELAVTVEPQADNLARITVSLGIASRIPIVGRFRPDLRLQSSLITYVEPG
jgi:TadE-like protein